ncbi:hypothetical protein ENSA5_16980 [Enhygromyxa salina]|uniref:Uncharacterized protein n=1 Tax=Enhygromyxa salina TaxID=215803 RepID=A0A2S9YDW1_9BACT|nr:hypothetical protein [Enhygromyxa salina]PRQ03308.1 hypothetical protein ENSA5_16980 [Enhygromyxa salina]
MVNSVFTVKAKANSITGGKGLNTGITVGPGQLLVVSADPNDQWSAGSGPRRSNANGLGNPLGQNFGLHTHAGGQSFLFGALVGSLDGGETFFGVGTYLVMTVLTKGELSLYYWDSNNHDNSDQIRVVVNMYGGPTNVQ